MAHDNPRKRNEKRRKERVEQQLGVSLGSATHKLRKMIIFHLIKDSDLSICFKCKNIIDNCDELSIEHKLPWEGISSELFWDMENIAFSHQRCNTPHKRPRPSMIGHVGFYQPNPRIISPEGKSWCKTCKSFKEIAQFHKKSNRWNGLQSDCVACAREKRFISKHHV